MDHLIHSFRIYLLNARCKNTEVNKADTINALAKLVGRKDKQEIILSDNWHGYESVGASNHLGGPAKAFWAP